MDNQFHVPTVQGAVCGRKSADGMCCMTHAREHYAETIRRLKELGISCEEKSFSTKEKT